MTHFLRPRLRAEDTGLELDLVAETALVDGLGEICRIRRGAADNRGAEVCHELKLTIGVARGHRERQTADLMGTAVQTGAAGEQAVAIGYMADIILGTAGCADCAGTAVLPEIEVVLGVERYNTTSGRAGGGLDAHTVTQRLCKQTIGILIAQVILRDERQLMEIFDAVDILRLDAGLIHAVAIKLDVVVYVLDLLDQSFALQCFELFYRHGLDFWLIIVFHLGNSPCF